MFLFLSFLAAAQALAGAEQAQTPIHSNVTSGATIQPATIPIAPLASSNFPDCVNGPLKNNTVCDTSKDAVTRAKALVAAMTTTELIHNSVHQADGVDRLGLPPYNWWSEALHGVAWTGPGVSFSGSGDFSYATSFPMPIVLGAAFDDELVKSVASTISTEARAFSNAARAGLDWFAPNINPWRDPRWGRGQECPGEDAFHSGQYVYQLIDGFQGGINPQPYIKNIAVCKHWAGYDMDDWDGIIQREFDAIITPQELSEYFVRPFQSCVRDAKVNAVMCSYNSLNGVPTCADPYILDDILVGYYGLSEDSWRVSDCDAVQSIFENHNYTSSYQAAAAVAIKAGTDLNCGSIYYNYLQTAIDEGLVERSDIEKAMVRLYASLVRLGYFDPPESQPYRQISWKQVGTPAAEKLAYTVAAEGLVLLKNDGTLPLKKSLKKMAIVGPWGNATDQMQGNYYGVPPFLITPALGASAAGYEVDFVPGMSSVTDTSTGGFADAITAAKAADVVVFIGGIDDSVEAEGLDRTTIDWPGVQLELIQQLAAVGKPFVVVQCGAGQVDDSWLLSSKKVGAILWAGYPGQSGGTAIFDIVSGKVAPAGRLPLMQYPADYVNEVPMTDMNLRPNNATGNPGRTYQWYTGTPVIDYGFGLHYTKFALKWQTRPASVYDISALVTSARGAAHLDLGVFDTFGINVHNTGKTASDFVVLLFAKTTAGPGPFPNKSLIGYTRVHALGAGSAAVGRISVTLGSIARADESGNLWLYPGDYTLSVDVPESLTHRFVLTGEAVQLSQFPVAPK
ncbi:unnamed protein product [Mycena citricolor]|uniref:xylan 1,4-beta-xylosidase n=1 Tax=Mycena citricolor TaxID=2018698 RepID=A0AAD2HUY1_9AGAR|nr:unnamed protein product [Mycena citricolor]